jgi:cytochrome c5
MRSNSACDFRAHLSRLFVLAIVFISLAAPIYAQSPANALPAGTGRDLVAVACTQCHGLKLIMALRDGPVGWRHFVDDMILRGAQLNPEEADTVAQYLSKNFGPGTSPMQSGVKTEPLPPGDGEKLVESHCVLCHDLGRITTVARSKEEWNNTVGNMMTRAGTKVATQEEILTMASYLAAHFGKKPS